MVALIFFAETSFCTLSRGYQVEGNIYFEKLPEKCPFLCFPIHSYQKGRNIFEKRKISSSAKATW